MHVYAFGSVCRGEIARDSDVDLLAITEGFDHRFDPNTYSIYSYDRIAQLWNEGNPFAWHLSQESRLIFASDSRDFLANLGSPNPYHNCARDCEKFYAIFQSSCSSLSDKRATTIFELSTIFLSMRNIASCYALGVLGEGHFSRDAALRLGQNSAPIPVAAYRLLERSRLLSTRGYGASISTEQVQTAIAHLAAVRSWMEGLVEEAKQSERVQQQS